MKDQEKLVNGQADYQTKVNQTSDGIMELFEIMDGREDDPESSESLSGSGNDSSHSLVCNNELFNKELWAIVDDTAHEQ